MPRVRWLLADFLEQRNLTAYAVAKACDTSRMNTIYRMARRGREPKRVDLHTLAILIQGLQKVTGEHVTIGDVLEYWPYDHDPVKPAF